MHFHTGAVVICILKVWYQSAASKQARTAESIHKYQSLRTLRWMFIHAGSDASSHPRVMVCDVLLSTVRETGVGDSPYCFEIYSANRRSYMLQAEGPLEHAAWIAAIRQCISDQVRACVVHTQCVTAACTPCMHSRCAATASSFNHLSAQVSMCIQGVHAV